MVFRKKKPIPRYIAIIGDLVDSRNIPSRAKFQKEFNRILRNINVAYADSLSSKFNITIGDEFQGLLKDATNLSLILDTIVCELYPVKVRFGIGVGNISTEIDPERSLGADGSAYWAAREAIIFIHENNDYGTSRIRLSCAHEMDTKLINSSFAANGLILDGWRRTQMAVLQAIITSGMYGKEFLQVELAMYMGLTPASLQKRIKGSGVKVYIRNGCAISAVINNLKK